MPSVDFAAVRRAIPMESVLDLLGFVPTTRRGNQLQGACPLHDDGSETSCCFSVNLAKNAFRCFSCSAAGNQLDLWSKAHKLPLYESAIDLCHRAQLEVPLLHPKQGRTLSAE